MMNARDGGPASQTRRRYFWRDARARKLQDIAHGVQRTVRTLDLLLFESRQVTMGPGRLRHALTSSRVDGVTAGLHSIEYCEFTAGPEHPGSFRAGRSR